MRRRLLQPLAQARRVGRHGREHRLVEPSCEKGVDAVAFDDTRQLLVGRDACRTSLGIDDARRAADEHEAVHEIRVVERDTQAQPGAHRVAGIDPAPPRAAIASAVPANVAQIGRSTASTSQLTRTIAATPCHELAVCVNPGTNTTFGTETL